MREKVTRKWVCGDESIIGFIFFSLFVPFIESLSRYYTDEPKV